MAHVYRMLFESHGLLDSACSQPTELVTGAPSALTLNPVSFRKAVVMCVPSGGPTSNPLAAGLEGKQ